MLCSNSSSSIQKRRQHHRRQQSLEVPILTTPLPANPRRNPPGRAGHRRGRSLDQSLSVVGSPTGFRPSSSQEITTQPAWPSVRIRLDTTNQPTPDLQHFVQETQQQRPAQPGYQAQDFSTHLQRQLNRALPSSSITASQPSDQHQQQAFEQLQSHLEWYRNTYGSSPNSNMSTTPFFDFDQPVACEMPTMAMGLPMSQPMPGMPATPISQGHARTVPNTPQAFTRGWPSPPPTSVKHVRSQSFQPDVAPMPGSFSSTASFGPPADSFNQDMAAFTNDQGYASSAYSSSAVDPSSPVRQLNSSHMPTLFEEPTSPLGTQPAQIRLNESSLLLQATAGAIQDFNDPEFVFGAPMAMSPRQQLLNQLGPDVPASIVDTGVPAHEVQQYIGELSEEDNKYPCLWYGCRRRFGRKENVRAHVQTHLGDRQFKCNLCDKTFVRQHDLKRHIAIHSDDRPHVCPCGTGFARHDALTRHRQRGMCNGVLPGFEKTEEEKPKRGRPKKERPDIESRVDKASKQRRKNKEKADVEDNGNYASSSSGASDRSFPDTPPDTSDAFDANEFLDLANDNMHFNSVTSSWRDTPPTSPVSASPTKTVSLTMVSKTSSPSDHHISDYASPAPTNNVGGSFHGGSSPFGFDDFNDGGISAQPEAVWDFVMSPPGDSSSSVYGNLSDPMDEVVQLQSPLVGPVPMQKQEKSLMEVLDEWIAAH